MTARHPLSPRPPLVVFNLANALEACAAMPRSRDLQLLAVRPAKGTPEHVPSRVIRTPIARYSVPSPVTEPRPRAPVHSAVHRFVQAAAQHFSGLCTLCSHSTPCVGARALAGAITRRGRDHAHIGGAHGAQPAQASRGAACANFSSAQRAAHGAQRSRARIFLSLRSPKGKVAVGSVQARPCLRRPSRRPRLALRAGPCRSVACRLLRASQHHRGAGA